MSTYEDRDKQRTKDIKRGADAAEKSAAANEKTARETGRLADAQADTAYATQDLANAQHRIAALLAERISWRIAQNTQL